MPVRELQFVRSPKPPLHAINCGFGRVRGIMPQPGEAGKRILEVGAPTTTGSLDTGKTCLYPAALHPTGNSSGLFIPVSRIALAHLFAVVSPPKLCPAAGP